MEYRALGKTGLLVSALGYGASPLGGVFGAIDENDGIACVHTALDGGINFLDVSPFYGETRAEMVLGKALRTVGRDRYILSTKVGRYGSQDFDFSADRVTRSVDESLERLGVEYVDLIQCHDIEFGSLDQIARETLPALRKVIESGKARFVGITGLPLSIYPRILEETGVDVILSYCHHTLVDDSLSDMLPFFAAHEIGVINASPLAMGLLSGRTPPSWHPAPPELRQACTRAADYCLSRNADLAQIAVWWSATHSPKIATTLVGSAQASEIKKNIAALDRAPDPELLKGIMDILSPVHNLSWVTGRPENNPPAPGDLPPS